MGTLTPFWPQVLHTTRIDLSRFELPSGTKEICFKFVDPIWGWLVAARRQNPLELHWKPLAQRLGRELYGQGIHCGQLFKHACASVPRGSFPMCVGLHWDGTGAHGLSSSPICVCVGNSNSCKSDTQFCIGYMPHVPDEKTRMDQIGFGHNSQVVHKTTMCCRDFEGTGRGRVPGC